MKLINSVKTLYKEYPRQYWLMVAGVLLATAGGSMIWPFLIIYASSKLNMPLSAVASLISINAGIGLLSSLIAGMVADKIGRKIVMTFSLIGTAVAYFLLMRAETYPQFAALMVLIGLSNPLYQVGADAMLADMIPAEKRTDAFSISRIANNAGFAMGPAIGGFLATRSYDLAFYCASLGYLSYSLLLIFFARETLVKLEGDAGTSLNMLESMRGYSNVLHDRSFVAFVFTISMGLIAPVMVWILMPVYSKTNFGVLESIYGWIPTTNGVLCVFAQYPVTAIARRYRTLPVLTAGMFIYAIAVGSVAIMSSFWGFWFSMVLLTLGELTLVPTASKYVTDLAPAGLRGRYISIYWLGWGLARTLAPLIGGTLNDSIAPRAIWIGGLLIGITSAAGLFLLSRLSLSASTSTAES